MNELSKCHRAPVKLSLLDSGQHNAFFECTNCHQPCLIYKKQGFAAIGEKQARAIQRSGGRASPANFKNDKKRASQIASRPRGKKNKGGENGISDTHN